MLRCHFYFWIRWRPLYRPGITTLLLTMLLSAASAQMVPPPFLRPVIPSIEAAKEWEENRPRPIHQVQIKLKPGVDPAEFARTFSAWFRPRAVVPTDEAPSGAPAPALQYLRSNWRIQWHVYRLPSPQALEETLQALRSRPEVLVAWPDQGIRLLAPPPNPRWNQIAEEYLFSAFLQGPYGGLGGILDQPPRYYDSSAWRYNAHLEMVRAQRAWEIFPGYYPTAAQRAALPPSRLPIVAVLDTGIDYNHPAFGYGGPGTSDVGHGGHILTSLGRNFYNGNRTPNPMGGMDVFGHGTSVAGLIGAAPHTLWDIPGLGFMSRLLPVRVFGPAGDGYDSDLWDAIVYAVDAGALLINVSARTDIGYSPALKDAVDYAWDRGALVIAAIGNDGKNTNDEPTFRRYPASLSRVLSVGASTYSADGLPGGYWIYDPDAGTNVFVNYSGTYYVNELPAAYSNYGQNLGVVAPGGDGIFFENNAPGRNDDFWQIIMMQFMLPPPSGLGMPPGAVPELVFNHTTAPTYPVPMNDETNSGFGAYAQIGFYRLERGCVPGTSFAAPIVTGLAALYAARNGITRSTPDAPQRILQAIQRGADNVLLPEDPGYRTDGGFGFVYGWGRINAEATLLDRNQRNATVGGIVGVVTVGGTVVGNVLVTATRPGHTTRTATTTPDGVYHLINLPAGTWTVSTTAFGYSGQRTVNVRAGCDTHAIDFRLNDPITVTVEPREATLAFGDTLQFNAVVTGTSDTRVIWDLPVSAGATISSTGLFRAPNAPGSSFEAVVRATSRADTNKSGTAIVTLVSRVSGTVDLEGAVNRSQTLTFEFVPSGSGTARTFTTALNPDGSFSLTGVEPGMYTLRVKGSRWLRRSVTVNAAGGNVTGLQLLLLAGDANNDNAVDVLDLDALIAAFDRCQGDAGFNPGADFNCDGCVDVLDLDLLVRNFDRVGDL
ncbi:MAG: S8 family serine peptidase [Chloroherpetonaceae bacterium]|nr:S8 family serine peptidase [Chthonomonadaceae bacterium]MDW8207741.1 S8 family serine peptidase [Chloroherpetonaceae bacterium]